MSDIVSSWHKRKVLYELDMFPHSDYFQKTSSTAELMNSSGDILSSYAAFFKNHIPMQPEAVIKAFTFALTYIATNIINGMLLFTYFKHAVFYENARYVLFIHLVINDMLELSVALTLYIWLDHHPFILVPVCYFLLVLAATSTMNMPINLAVMALERYAAVCFPLHHGQICSLQRTYLAIGVIWLIGVIPSVTDLFMVFTVESTAFFHRSIFCIRESLLRTPKQADNRVYFMVAYLSVVWLILVFTYLKIVLAARSASSSEKTTAKKARNTVLLHGGQLILAMLTYTSPVFEQLLLTLPAAMRPNINYARYYLIYIVPRALSPIIYGLRDENFRKHLKAHCFQNQVLPAKVQLNP